MSVPADGIAAAVFPRMAKREGIPARDLRTVVAVSVAAAICVVAAGAVLAAFVFSSAYPELPLYVAILAVAYALRGVAALYSGYLAARGRGEVLRRAGFALTAANVVPNFTLIPAFGGIGAAWAGLIAMALNLAMLVRGYRPRRLGRSLDPRCAGSPVYSSSRRAAARSTTSCCAGCRTRSPTAGPTARASSRPRPRVGLGHRRLSILDSSTAAPADVRRRRGAPGLQRRDLQLPGAARASSRRDGTRFATDCDTEVILHLYAAYGDAAVERLDGMFAFALWDPRAGELLLARDPLGEKPLYWADRDGRLVFGSEIKALLAHPAVDARGQSGAALARLPRQPRRAGPEDPLRRHQQAPSPGTLCAATATGVRIRRYRSMTADRAASTRATDLGTRRRHRPRAARRARSTSA